MGNECVEFEISATGTLGVEDDYSKQLNGFLHCLNEHRFKLFSVVYRSIESFA